MAEAQKVRLTTTEEISSFQIPNMKHLPLVLGKAALYMMPLLII